MEKTMTKDEMLQALAQATNHCSDVYFAARTSGDTELEDLMSSVDSCIMEAIDMVERSK
jgi:hypothetical protein